VSTTDEPLPCAADEATASAEGTTESSRALTLREKLEVSWKRIVRDAKSDFAQFQFEIRAFDRCAKRELDRADRRLGRVAAATA